MTSSSGGNLPKFSPRRARGEVSAESERTSLPHSRDRLASQWEAPMPFPCKGLYLESL